MTPKSFTYKSLPQNRIIRITIGVLFIIGGILGFLPILGFWMIPVGLLFLSIDFAIARRWRRKIEVWWGRKGKAMAKNLENKYFGWLRKKKSK